MNLWMSPVKSDSVKKPPTKRPLIRGSMARDLLRRHRAPDEPTLLQEPVDPRGVGELLLRFIDMQDAALFGIEAEALGLGHLEEMPARRDGELRGRDRVALVVLGGEDELGHPGELVPGGRGVDEQRRVLPQHPLDALQEGRRLVPDLGVRGGQLAAIGEGRLHRGIGVAVEDRHVEAALQELVGGGDAGDAGADDSDGSHDNPFPPASKAGVSVLPLPS